MSTSPQDNEASTPSTATFFSILEMLDALLAKASIASLLTLRSVDRVFKDITNNYLWSYINFRDPTEDSHRGMNSNRLLASAASIAVINENRSFIRSLSIPTDFAWIYFEATIGALHNSAPWLTAPACKPDYVPIALQPFNDLIDFKWEQDYTCDIQYHPFDMTPLGVMFEQDEISALSSILPAIWVISTNSKLVSVSLMGFSCINHVWARQLIHVLSTLSVLKELCIMSSGTIPFDFTRTLFQCLPASVQKLELVYDMDDTEAASFARDLRLPVFDNHYSPEIIAQFLKECPGLTTLVAPQPMRADMVPSTGSMLADTIHLHCPLVRHIYVLDPVRNEPVDRESVIATLNVLNPMHVQTLLWRCFHDVTNNVALPSISLSLNRFASTLTFLKLYRICDIASSTVASILSGCEALTTLVLRGADPSKYMITLEGATTANWVCSSLEILDIAIGLAVDGSDYTMAPGNPR
ncbi:hypothetical protein BGW39_010510 [Mortierella sp. 14UC]|nr:hypothetical protein BGW39_010510 [Mortierella sp. 14UC]